MKRNPLCVTYNYTGKLMSVICLFEPQKFDEVSNPVPPTSHQVPEGLIDAHHASLYMASVRCLHEGLIHEWGGALLAHDELDKEQPVRDDGQGMLHLRDLAGLSGISRTRFIHYSNQTPCSSNVFLCSC